MRGSINLLFGVHNHQPVGNFGHIFRKANQNCYRPFVDTLYRYPQIKSTFHFSGSLIDWFLQNDPELLQKIKEMVKRHQVEILTGGYFEPILSIIPERDRLGQIKMLSDFIKDYFEEEPKGMWIGERVWEPQLTKSIVASGIKYILLDDFHFHSAGIEKERLSGYYLTEVAGETLAIFPISKKLRYSIPFSLPSEPIDYLRDLSDEKGDAGATIVDDGEKFGLWPGTYKWVYRQKWLEKFLQLLIKHQAWLKTLRISEYMQKHPPLGLCNLPSASYEEMTSWSAGRFTNFFNKYPEANNLHKRMIYISDKIAEHKTFHQDAIKYLYMSQSNCPYWHGVFGGVYLGHLRHLAYKNLISAQVLLEKNKGDSWIETEFLDFDRDSADEWILRNPFLDIFIAPQQGGAIFEFDYKPQRINLVDAMTRRPETYHKNIKLKPKNLFKLRNKKIINIHDLLVSKEKGLKDLLIYDSYRRLSLLDHFLKPNLSLKDFQQSQYEELGDFINSPYLIEQKENKHEQSIILQRKGRVHVHGVEIPLIVTKELSLNDRSAQVILEYELQNLSADSLDVLFAIEFNLSPEESSANSLICKAKGAHSQKYCIKDRVEADDISNVHIIDDINSVESIFNFEQKCKFWSFPLETISASEQGFERNYQQTVALPHWSIRLEKIWKTKITLIIKSLP